MILSFCFRIFFVIDWDNHKGPYKLFCDDKSTLNIAYNPIQHHWTSYRNRLSLH